MGHPAPVRRGYSVGCPDLPGGWSQGETESEARENIASTIEEYLAAVAELKADSESSSSGSQ